MYLEGKEEGAAEASGGGLVNGAKVYELKNERKRKTVVSGEDRENLAVRKRFLRSDVAKQRVKEAEEAKKKDLEGSPIVLDLDSNISKQNVIDETISVKELKVEKKRVLRSSSVRKTESGKTPMKKFLEEAVVRDHQHNGIDTSTAEDDIEAESKSTVSSEVTEKRETDKVHLKRSTEEAIDGDHLDDTFQKDIEAPKDSFTKSDVAKQRRKAGIEDKRAIVDSGSSAKIVTEDMSLGSDHNDNRFIIGYHNGAEQIKSEEEKVVGKDDAFGGILVSETRLMGVGEVFDSNKKQVAAVVALGDGNNREKNDIDEKINDEAIRVKCKRNMELDVVEWRRFDDTAKEVVMVEAASETGQKIKAAVRNKKNWLNIRVENRRFTRSSTAKLMEEAGFSAGEVGPASADQKKPTERVSSEAIQNENSVGISNQTGGEIEEMIVGSNICKKNSTGRKIEVGKRRGMKSEVAKQRDEADSSKMRKKFLESELERKRSRQASDICINRKKTKKDSSSCIQDWTEELEEGKKLMLGSRKSCISGPKESLLIKRQKDGLNGKRIKSNLKNGSRLEAVKVKWSKHLGQMTLKQLKQNNGSPVGFSKENSNSSPHKRIKMRGRGRPPKKMLGSEKSHIQMAIGKTWSFKKEEVFCETGIRPDVASPLKEPKNVDASRDRGDVILEGESITSHLTNKEKEAELRMARQKLRGQIKGMLFNAGWKLDLRPRHGKNYIDAVYIAPNGCTHWSIVKAYYAFQKQVSSEGDDNGDKGRHLSGKPCKKSRKSSFPPFAPIPEEALSILKHPISRRRTRKEMEEAEMKLGDGSIHKKKHKKHLKDKSSKRKSSRAKGVINTAGKKTHLGKHRRKPKGCALLVRSFNHDAETGTDVYVPYAWKRTTLSWMIDLGVMPENAEVKYMNRRHTKTLLKGQITRDGIHCSCCSKTLTVSGFEIHSGSKQCNPYQNIVVEGDDTSLLECQINAWKKQDESERKGFYFIDIHGDDPNDDTCGICGDGGDLICCDGCPSTFHQSCLGTEMLPPGDWYCMNCSCRYCALNSGIVAQGNGGIDSPLLSCSQCEEKYHQSCVPEEDAVRVSSSRSCSSFCGQNCKKLFEKLRMLLGVKNDLDAEFSWTIVQRFDDDLPESVCSLDQRAECNSKIAVAFAVMDECFLPIIDQRSGINLIHNVVYNCGSNFDRLNYCGFYTFILERNDEIICVASLRIHGTRVAEMPFIGTRNMYRRQGMCRRLLNEIESVLRDLNVEKLIIPAISELKDTWTNVFGFKLLEVSEKEELRSINLLVFPDTGLLLKSLLGKDAVEHCKTADEDQFEHETTSHHAPEEANELVLPANVDPEPHVSDDVTAPHKLGVKHSDPSLSVSDSCMESHSNVSAKPSDAHVGFEAPELKSSEIAAQKNLPVQPEAVSHDEPVSKSRFQKDSSFFSLKTKLTCEGAVHEDNSVLPTLLSVQEGNRSLDSSEDKFLNSSEESSAHAVNNSSQ